MRIHILIEIHDTDARIIHPVHGVQLFNGLVHAVAQQVPDRAPVAGDADRFSGVGFYNPADGLPHPVVYLAHGLPFFRFEVPGGAVPVMGLLRVQVGQLCPLFPFPLATVNLNQPRLNLDRQMVEPVHRLGGGVGSL